MKSVAPKGNPLSLQTPQLSTSKIVTESILNNKYLKAYENYKYKSADKIMDMFKDEYKISPNMLIYKGTVPLNKLPAGSTESVYMGGHFVTVSNAGKLVVPSGISLTGGFKKGLSPKTKSILINVFGMDIEE